jgi:hypothetical protein
MNKQTFGILILVGWLAACTPAKPPARMTPSSNPLAGPTQTLLSSPTIAKLSGLTQTQAALSSALYSPFTCKEGRQSGGPLLDRL